jgi:NADH-quinone oxidoreductase subunit H
MTATLMVLFTIAVFPGFLYMTVAGFVGEYVDRKLYARFQNRVGPPWYQPLADSIKLLTKEVIIPAGADRVMFRLMPILSLAAAVAALFYIPLWSAAPGAVLHAFEGDLVVVLYLLTIPTLAFFLGGWYSQSLFAAIGSVRALTQLFAYEVPLFMAVLAPSVIAGTWSLSGMATFYNDHPALALTNLLGFAVALVALLGKLEKVPFDIPEAETEIVGGTFTEYSGRLLAFLRLTVDIEAGVAASLLAAVFLPWGLNLPAVVAFGLYVAKVLLVFALLALLRSIFARLRLEQMVEFCWKWLAPAALIQLLVSLVVSMWVSP